MVAAESFQSHRLVTLCHSETFETAGLGPPPEPTRDCVLEGQPSGLLLVLGNHAASLFVTVDAPSKPLRDRSRASGCHALLECSNHDARAQ